MLVPRLTATRDATCKDLSLYFVLFRDLRLNVTQGISSIFSCGECKSPFFKTSDFHHAKADPITINNSLEATFGVIAAAAPSIRALFRRNSVPNRYASPNMPGSIPLQSTVSGTAAYVSRRCWCPPGEDEEPMAHGDENYKEQAEGTPNSGMWSAHGGNRGGIVKTTDVHVLHSSASHCTS